MKENKEEGFISHLTELRKRLIHSFIFLTILHLIFNFLIIEIFFLDFSNTKIFLNIFLLFVALNIEEPINPHPIIEICSNIKNLS